MIDCNRYFNRVFLGSLKPLFDLKWQEKGWGGLDDPSKYVGFNEIVMGFAEACEVILSNPDRYYLSIKQQEDLKKLLDMIDAYDLSEDRPDDEKEIINDPEWHKIREFARVVYDDLKNVKYVADEK